MSDTRFESGGVSFFSGRKKYARCQETYVDKYNAVAPASGGRCSLTYNKFYEIVDQGTFYNPTNAFNTYFPMIFIKDDNLNIWGLPEEMFNMEHEYASAATILEKSKPQENPSLPYQEEKPQEEVFEDEEWDNFHAEELEEDVILEPVPVSKISSSSTIAKPKEASTNGVKVPLIKIDADWVKLIKEKYFLGREYNYKVTAFPLALLKEAELKSFLPEGVLLVIGWWNSYFIIRNTPQGIYAENFAKGEVVKYREIDIYLETPVSNLTLLGEKEMLKTNIFISSSYDLKDLTSKEFTKPLDEWEEFIGTSPSVEIIKMERI